MADNSSAQLAEEVTEICGLMRKLISRQQQLESDMSWLAREVGRLGVKVPALNYVVVENGLETRTDPFLFPSMIMAELKKSW